MNLLDKLGISLCQFKHAAAHFSHKHANSCLCCGIIVILRALPSALKHADEILVIRNTHGQICIVIKEFLSCDDTVVVALSTIEVVEELGQDLLLGLSVFDKLCIHRNVENVDHIIDINFA